MRFVWLLLFAVSCVFGCSCKPTHDVLLDASTSMTFLTFADIYIGGCGLLQRLSRSQFSCWDVGQPGVPVTLTGSNGTCTTLVTTRDIGAPIVRCKANSTVTMQSPGIGWLNSFQFLDVVYDNCWNYGGTYGYGSTPLSVSCNKNLTQATFSVTDSSGNVGSCVSTVIELDPQNACKPIVVNVTLSSFPFMISSLLDDLSGTLGTFVLSKASSSSTVTRGPWTFTSVEWTLRNPINLAGEFASRTFWMALQDAHNTGTQTAVFRAGLIDNRGQLASSYAYLVPGDTSGLFILTTWNASATFDAGNVVKLNASVQSLGSESVQFSSGALYLMTRNNIVYAQQTPSTTTAAQQFSDGLIIGVTIGAVGCVILLVVAIVGLHFYVKDHRDKAQKFQPVLEEDESSPATDPFGASEDIAATPLSLAKEETVPLPSAAIDGGEAPNPVLESLPRTSSQRFRDVEAAAVGEKQAQDAIAQPSDHRVEGGNKPDEQQALTEQPPVEQPRIELQTEAPIEHLIEQPIEPIVVVPQHLSMQDEPHELMIVNKEEEASLGDANNAVADEETKVTDEPNGSAQDVLGVADSDANSEAPPKDVISVAVPEVEFSRAAEFPPDESVKEVKHEIEDCTK